MKMYQEKSKTKYNYWLALPVIVLCLFVAACTKQNIQLEENQAESLELSKEIPDYIPQDFQEKIKELQAKYPEQHITFIIKYSVFMQRDLDESEDGINGNKIAYYRPISVQEEEQYVAGDFKKHINELIKAHGENSKEVKERQEGLEDWFTNELRQPKIGYVYMRPLKEYVNDMYGEADNTVYTEVDTYPSPRDGAAFHTEMLKFINFSECFKGIKATDLQGDMILEAVVTKEEKLIRVNLIEGIRIVMPIEKQKNIRNPMLLRNPKMTLEDTMNSLLFQAFQNRSALRGWKAGIKNGQRVDTKIRFTIPLKEVEKVLVY